MFHAASEPRWGQQLRPPAECEWHGLEAGDAEFDAGLLPQHEPKPSELPWLEQAKHCILLLRLQRPYYLYCLLCSTLAAAAFLSTLMDFFGDRTDRRWLDILEGGTWQSACWSVVALSLVGEVISVFVVSKGMTCHELMEDWWFMFDATIVGLTLFTWMLMLVRRATPMREEAEEVELWLLMLRFILQPCRVLVAAKMARKVQVMQNTHTDVNFDVLADEALGAQQKSMGDFYARSPAPRSTYEASLPVAHVTWA